MGNTQTTPTSILRFKGELSEMPSEEACESIAANEDFVRARLSLTLNCFSFPSNLKIAFSLLDENDRNAAISAAAFDAMVIKCKPILIPKKMSEQVFFYNYFSHFATIRRKFLPDSLSINTELIQEFKIGNQIFHSVHPNLCFGNANDISEFSKIYSQCQNGSTRHRREGNYDIGNVDFDVYNCQSLLFFSNPLMHDLVLNRNHEFDWKAFQCRVLQLSRNVETFLDFDLVPPDQLFANEINNFKFDHIQDMRAVQAAWLVDPFLYSAFCTLSPTFVEKNEFWNNYLHHVAALASNVLQESF